jgi:hypothetical protein
MAQKNKNIWLVFGKDEGNRDDCNVYYSWLVIAKDKKTALKISADEMGINPKDYEAIKPELYCGKSIKSIKLKIPESSEDPSEDSNS